MEKSKTRKDAIEETFTKKNEKKKYERETRRKEIPKQQAIVV